MCLGIAIYAAATLLPEGIIWVFLAGAAMLLLGGPLIPLALVILPIRWAWRAERAWLGAASLPAVSLAILAVAFALPDTGILPAVAFSNLGPPVVAGWWGAGCSIYVGVFALVLPVHANQASGFVDLTTL
jgi:hypothetical protein